MEMFHKQTPFTQAHKRCCSSCTKPEVGGVSIGIATIVHMCQNSHQKVAFSAVYTEMEHSENAPLWNPISKYKF